MSEYKIITKGGTMCFYGEWFGRPYDNFHRIAGAAFEDNCLTVYFENNEILTVLDPSGITNNKKCFEIKKASKVIWKHIPFGSSAANEYSYSPCEDGRILKTAFRKEHKFYPQKDIAVQCLSY